MDHPPLFEGVLAALGLLGLFFAIIAWLVGVTRMTAERRAKARVFEGTIKAPTPDFGTYLDDGKQWRDLSDMTIGLVDKRARVTVEELD